MAYTAIKELGRGGFGVVELVENEDGKFFARKTLHIPNPTFEKQLKARFSREVRYQSKIDHENIVEIVDFDLKDDPPFFVMPLADCTLLDEMRIDRHLSGKAEEVLFHILDDLEEIHRRGYLHRDLKPANVLKFVDEKGLVTYALSDFGLMAVGEEATSSLTQTGLSGGTPLYQAPECATDFKRATERSDIYSFGAVLHDIFAQNPKRLPHTELTTPGEIGKVIEKCTKRNPLRRFSEIATLREALFSALSTFEYKFQSGEEEKIVKLLSDTDTLPTSEQWDEIFSFLEENDANENAIKNIFRATRGDHIEALNEEGVDLFDAYGRAFASYASSYSFDFDFCDIIANKAQKFYDLGTIRLKSEIAVAMLSLGITHNRWFVMRKFIRMAGRDISQVLADRIVTELEVSDFDEHHFLDRLKEEVRISKDAVHAKIRALMS